MSPKPSETEILQTGEYGASVVEVTKTGSMTRIAFGRAGAYGPVYYLGVMIPDDVRKSLIEQLTAQDGSE